MGYKSTLRHSGDIASVSLKCCYQLDAKFHPMPLDKRKPAQGVYERKKIRILAKFGSMKMITTMDEQWPFENFR